MKTQPTNTLPKGPDGWTDQLVKFCNHEAVFVADVIITAEAVSVIAKGQIKLIYVAGKVSAAQWLIVDHNGGYWNPTKGRFLLPRESVAKLTS